jgi:hypothetical protein
LKNTISKHVEKGLVTIEQYLYSGKISNMKRESSESKSDIGSKVSNSTQDNTYFNKSNENNYSESNNADQSSSIYGHPPNFITGMVLENRLPNMTQFDFRNPSEQAFGNISVTYPPSQPINLPNTEIHHPHSYTGHGEQSEERMINSTYIQDVSNSADFHGSSLYGGPGGSSWYQYNQSITAGIGLPEFTPAADALMQLGGRTENNGSGNFTNLTLNSHQEWPLVVLDPRPDDT